MATTQYIGSRYVPLFADPAEWNNTRAYEPLTIVLHEGNSYTSKQYVPKGIDISNEDFWAETGNYNAQIELYRQDVSKLKNNMIAIPEEYGAIPGEDSTASLQKMINENKLVDGRGNTYLVSDTLNITGTIQNITLIATGDTLSSVVNISSDFTATNLEIDGNGIADHCITIVPSNGRVNEKAKGFISESYFHGALKSNVLCNGALECNSTKFASSEIGADCKSSDCKFDNAIFINCRTAINYVGGGLTVDNTHAWCTRTPNQADSYRHQQDNTPYPGTSNLITISENFASIHIGQVYVDTLTYVLKSNLKQPLQYANIDIANLNLFVNNSFYNGTDPDILFTDLEINPNSHIEVGLANLDFNGYGKIQTTFFPSDYMLPNILGSNSITVTNTIYKDFSPTINNWLFGRIYEYGEITSSYLGSSEIGPAILRNGFASRLVYKAGISVNIPENTEFAKIHFNVDLTNKELMLDLPIKVIDTTGLLHTIDIIINGKDITLKSRDAINGGIILC